MHRKKAVHMTFRRSRKIRRLFFGVVELIEKVGKQDVNKVH